MYKFNLCNKNTINDFNQNNAKGHIFQTTMWCDFKNDWQQQYFSGEDTEGNTVLTCSLLIRKIPYLSKKIGYIPRGN